jgi:hypothetical protein
VTADPNRKSYFFNRKSHGLRRRRASSFVSFLGLTGQFTGKPRTAPTANHLFQSLESGVESLKSKTKQGDRKRRLQVAIEKRTIDIKPANVLVFPSSELLFFET